MDNDARFIDSGASYHMTRMKQVFLSILEVDSNMQVRVGMSAILAVKGVGTMLFQLESGLSLEVAKVLYVLGLKMNCSQSQL